MAPRTKQVEIKTDDKGLNGVFARVLKSPRSKFGAEVGVFDDPESAEIAAIHELGRGNVPARSFMRATLERNRRKYAALSKRLFGRWLDGDMTVMQASAAIGETIRDDMQRAILKGVPPPLKEATVSAKRRRGLPRPSTALYATGRLFNAIKVRLLGGT
jgi:hypothetical protein